MRLMQIQYKNTPLARMVKCQLKLVGHDFFSPLNDLLRIWEVNVMLRMVLCLKSLLQYDLCQC